MRVILDTAGMDATNEKWPEEMEFPLAPLIGQRIVLWNEEHVGYVVDTYWYASERSSIHVVLFVVIGPEPVAGEVR